MLLDKKTVVKDGVKANVLVCTLNPEELRQIVMDKVVLELNNLNTQYSFTLVDNMLYSSQLDVQVLDTDTNSVSPLENRLVTVIFATIPDEVFDELKVSVN